MPTDPPSKKRHLREIASLFTRLGFTAFGGPAAHVAMMEREVVTRRHWLDRQHFLDLFAAINFIPGPSSTELATQLGYIRGGFPGLLVAGFCFIVPAVLIILPLAWLYVTRGNTPDVGAAFVGISACVVAIVAAACYRFGRTSIKDGFTASVTVVTAALSWLADSQHSLSIERVLKTSHQPIMQMAARAALAIASALRTIQPEIAILALAAIAGMIWYAKGHLRPAADQIAQKLAPLLFPIPIASTTGIALTAHFGSMALFFLKVGATLFGSGYVLLSYLRTGLVDGHHWLTHRQLLDAIAVGQVTPGPVLTTATFIGFILGFDRFGGGLSGGICGAVVATVAIFLPSFIFVSLLGPLLPRIRSSPLARGAFDAMNAAVVGLIMVVTLNLGVAALTGLLTIAIAVITLLAILLWDINTTWLILASAAVAVVLTK